MDLSHLRLNRVEIAGFKSLKQVKLTHLPSLVLFMGSNNAGKSNILDVFKFISDCTHSLEHAVASRGGKLSEVILLKREEGKLEFTFEFALSSEKRAELIASLFAENNSLTPEKALESNLLSTLTLKATISRDFVSEELVASNWKAENRPLLVFSIKCIRGKLECFSGCLETLCKQCSGELPAEVMTVEGALTKDGPLRLRLGRPDADGGYPISYELADLVFQQFATLDTVDPLRRLPTRSPIQGDYQLKTDASNLPDVLHWLYNNKPKLFRKIEAELAKMVPQLGKLYTPTIQNTAALGLIDSRDEDLVFSMDQMSFGTRSLITIVAKVILAKPGTWLCIEEPETYLHPKAQIGLFHFLRQESVDKRIFVATHSTSIAASCPVASLFVVQRDSANCTMTVPVDEGNAHHVIEQLGVRPAFSFESDVAVFVEDEDAVSVYEVWAKKYGFRIKIQFLDSGQGCTLSYFANARVAVSKFVHTLVFAVFGKSQGQPEKQASQQKTLKHLDLPTAQVFMTETAQTEAYLLDPKAILKAFPAITLSEAELHFRLVEASAEPRPKKILDDLFTEFRLGHYDGRHGARIAEQIEELPGEVRSFFEQVENLSKPFWKI